MALEKHDVLEELHIQRQQDGTYAAHQRRLHFITDDGVLLPEHTTYGPATALVMAEAGPIIGEAIAAITAECDMHKAAVYKAEQAIEEHRQAVVLAHAAKDEAYKILAQAQTAHEDHTQAMSVHIEDLQTKLKDVTRERDMALALTSAAETKTEIEKPGDEV